MTVATLNTAAAAAVAAVVGQCQTRLLSFGRSQLRRQQRSLAAERHLGPGASTLRKQISFLHLISFLLPFGICSVAFQLLLLLLLLLSLWISLSLFFYVCVCVCRVYFHYFHLSERYSRRLRKRAGPPSMRQQMPEITPHPLYLTPTHLSSPPFRPSHLTKPHLTSSLQTSPHRFHFTKKDQFQFVQRLAARFSTSHKLMLLITCACIHVHVCVAAATATQQEVNLIKIHFYSHLIRVKEPELSNTLGKSMQKMIA